MVQIPAVNTPQFEWMRSRMARRPRPVAPVYSPELAADAIVAAADGDGNDVFVGWPTILTATTNAVAPGVVDRYLAATGYESQQEDGDAVQPEQPDNLFEPVPLPVGATGRFGDETHTRAIRLSAPLARGALVLTAVAAAAGLASLGRFSKR
jgi:hypothetical protein